MKFTQKLLTPVLALASVFGGAAMAQDKAPLPDAPSAVTLKLPSLTDQWKYKDTHPDFSYKIPAPPKDSSAPFGDSFAGRIAGYVDRHSNDSQAPFDFAMGYQVKEHVTLLAGTLADPRKHTGQYEANRQAMRVMTGMSDFETRDLRDAMSGGIPGQRTPHGDGFGFGIKIQLGGRR